MSHEITLRLTSHHYARLIEMAGGEPPEDAAHDLLLRALDGDAVAFQVGAHYRQFEDQIRDLRRDLSVSTRAMLIALGNVPAEEARLWAEQNLG